MKYGIIIYPSRHIQNEANNLRKRYDSEYALIPPHITLKTRFNADDKTIEALIHELKVIANDTKPFDISIQKVSSFQPVSNKIYFKVEPNESLNKLNERLYKGTLSNDKDTAFVPHITVAQNLSTDEFADIYATLSMKDFSFTDSVDRIQLCYELENGSWTTYETFVFGKEKI